MKAFKDEKGRPRLFRPHLNITRLRRSSLRAGLPVTINKLIILFLKNNSRISMGKSF